jgi:hypothetical protein
MFDRINHAILMARVARRVQDPQVLKLIRRDLQAGRMLPGVSTPRTLGAAQGGPLSPLLANILWDDFDQELERRGRPNRGAVPTGGRAGTGLGPPIPGPRAPSLPVNPTKSAVDRLTRRPVLGFPVLKDRSQYRIGLAPESLRRGRRRLRPRTDRHAPGALSDRLKPVTRFLAGWVGYFGLADTPTPFRNLDSWRRHRFRAIVWRRWQRVRPRLRDRRALGVTAGNAWTLANARKGPWRVAAGPLNSVLTQAYWDAQGLNRLRALYDGTRLRWQ